MKFIYPDFGTALACIDISNLHGLCHGLFLKPSCGGVIYFYFWGYVILYLGVLVSLKTVRPVYDFYELYIAKFDTKFANILEIYLVSVFFWVFLPEIIFYSHFFAKNNFFFFDLQPWTKTFLRNEIFFDFPSLTVNFFLTISLFYSFSFTFHFPLFWP